MSTNRIRKENVYNNSMQLPCNGRELSNQVPTKLLPRFDWSKFIKTRKDLKLDQNCLSSFGSFKSIKLKLPFFEVFISAGYPSTVDDPYVRHLDLSKYLIKHPKSIYYYRASGHSMIKAGINHNDLLVVDTALQPKHRDIVIAILNGEHTLRRIYFDGTQIKLLTANGLDKFLTITRGMNFFVRGVVTTVIRTFNPLPYDNHFKDLYYTQF
ncbi:MAG: hypothetical protein FJX71_01120 [Alphaproteobacteria bacterium]|nr:hypothetical protein [Alphaproteobacteria bacterium]